MSFKTAAKFFAKVPLDGWDQITDQWDTEIAHGQLMSVGQGYQIIGQVSTGSRRILIPGERIDERYNVLRTPDQSIYLIANTQPNIFRNKVIRNVYYCHYAEHIISAYKFETTTLSSGVKGKPQETFIGNFFGSYYRKSSRQGAFEGVDIPLLDVYLNKEAYDVIDTDSILKVDDLVLHVEECLKHISLTHLICYLRKGS
jgi:hypothetical protein